MIGSSGTGSSNYAYYVAVGEAIKKYAPGISPTVIETGGAVDNINRINRKQLDIGLGNLQACFQAYYGKNPWEGKPNQHLRLLWSYNTNPMMFFVREESGIKSLRELTGKKFCAGARGSGGEKLVEEIFGILGIKPNYYRGDYNDAAAVVEDRQIVGMAKWSATETSGDALVIRLSTQNKLRFLSVSEEDLKKIITELPCVIPGYHPPNVYKGQDYEYRSIGGTANYIASTDLSPDLAYAIVQAAWKGIDIQAQSYPGLKGVNILKRAVDFSLIPLHAGAIKMCKEVGIEVPQRLIPPEYK